MANIFYGIFIDNEKIDILFFLIIYRYNFEDWGKKEKYIIILYIWYMWYMFMGTRRVTYI